MKYSLILLAVLLCLEGWGQSKKPSVKIHFYDSVYRVIIPKGKYEYIQVHKGDKLIKVTKSCRINYADIVDMDANDTETRIDTVGKLTVYPK